MTSAAWLAVLAVPVVLVALIATLRLSRRPQRVTTKAGEDIVSTRRGRPRNVSPRPAPPRRESSFPRLIRPKPVPEGKPARAATADPRLTAPVVLESGWSQTVYHGAVSTDGGAKAAVRAATVRGRSHAYNGEAGQDAAGVAWCEGRGSIFLVVADGLGSKPDSGQVAHYLVDQVTLRSAELRSSDDPAPMLRSVFSALEWYVRQKDIDGASTFVAAEVVLRRDGCDVTTWGIGDSEAWTLSGGRWKPLHHERRNDAENITRHLPGHHDMRSQGVRLPRGCVITLASDGFAGALGSDSPMARELADRWRTTPAALDFLSQVNFEDSYFNDDRAAVAVWIR